VATALIHRREMRVGHLQRPRDSFLEKRFPILARRAPPRRPDEGSYAPEGHFRHAPRDLHGQPAVIKTLAGFEHWRQRDDVFHRLNERSAP
jgi:hypothetical protein